MTPREVLPKVKPENPLNHPRSGSYGYDAVTMTIEPGLLFDGEYVTDMLILLTLRAPVEAKP
jgi:hypothetical protein